MSNNALTMFNQPGIPAHLAAAFGDEGNIVDTGVKVPSLSYAGKTWTISLHGEKTKLIRKNEDGDEVPVSVMRVVILDYGKRRGRAYYEGAYDPAKEGAPVCWSDDGVAPDPKSPKLQSTKCDTCPMAIKGSKVTETNKQVTACSQHRMLAVVPAHKLDFEPLRLKIAITSDFDRHSPDAEAQGWYAFSNYLDFIKTRQVSHTAQLVTKMKFDPNVAYPKLFFSPDRWLEPAEVAQVAPLTKKPEVAQLLAGTWTPAGVDGVRKDETTAGLEAPATKAQAATAAAATAEEPAPAPAPAPDDDDDNGEIIMAGLDAPAADTAQAPAQAATPAPAAAPAKADPAPAAAKAEAAAPAASTQVDPDVAALLAEWE
jgi:hypothetical protein